MKKSAAAVSAFMSLSIALNLCGSISAYAVPKSTSEILEQNYVLWRRSGIDDEGMFHYLADKNYVSTYFISTNLLPEKQDAWMQEYDSAAMLEKSERLTLYLNLPNDYYAVFYTKKWDDKEAVVSILEKYFPPYVLKGSGFVEGNYYEVRDNGEDIPWDVIHKELTDADLISEFYYPKEVYTNNIISIPYLTCYSSKPEYGTNRFEPEQVQAYVDAMHLPCTIQTEETQHNTWYYVIPDEALNYQEHFDLALQLYHALGIVPYVSEDWGASSLYPPMGVQVAGNVNADDELNIADVVMMTGCLTGAGDIVDRNAGDINRDGKVNAIDLTLLKRQIMDKF